LQLATTQLVVMPNEGGQPLGELMQGVEPGGRINRDGRNAVRDRIVEINSHPHKDVLRQQKLSQANKATLATRVYFFFSYHILPVSFVSAVFPLWVNTMWP
jgi:hypothetical protein